ncbi:MAG TPA: 8-amino-7-oxononanoate synthase [Phycisphaerae bacterium]|nr:8-amino-7-oxononanoate synthase [Phycisphaerae bacterium]
MLRTRESWLDSLARDLASRRDAHLLRELRQISTAAQPEITVGGVSFLQFASNNYLGLATHPQVIDAARDAIARFGTGSGASRLVTGSLALHHELENALARFKHTQAALLFPTGYMANLAVLTTFAGEHDGIVSDKLNHASLLDAARFSGAEDRTFPHRVTTRASELLARHRDAHPAARRFLVSDAVFSMDGDVADLAALADIAERTDALLFIDDAHGTGVLGPRGAGLAELQQVEGRIDLTVGTLSKALGSLGGFVAGPRAAIEMLINSARSFIFTTALPPSCAAAALAALHVIESDSAPRIRLDVMARHVRAELRSMGYDCGSSETPIIPVILGDPAAALAAAEFLKGRGIYIPAIRPPTVPPNAARLRISLMATHTDAHIAQLLGGFRALHSTS